MASGTQFVTDKNGKRKAVLLPIEEYEALMEDLQDLAVAAERRSEERLSFDEVKQQLQADGLL